MHLIDEKYTPLKEPIIIFTSLKIYAVGCCLFCNNVYWCGLVWSGNVCGIQTMNELYSALWMKQLL